jgi:predicted dehydrogenase
MEGNHDPNATFMTKLRVGLVGAGPWASMRMGPAVAANPDCELVGVWARRTEPAAALAEQCDTTAFEDFDAMLDEVEAVLFCVPPDVQVELATRAALAGRHLLLDKPVGLTLQQAQALVDVIQRTGVRSQVFFTARYTAETRGFIDQCRTTDLLGIQVTWLTGAVVPGSPFATPWRLSEGVLMDVGPHALDLVEACAGPITEVTLEANTAGLVGITCHHERGALSQMLLSFGAATQTPVWRCEAYDAERSWSHPTPTAEASAIAAQTALTEFARAVRSGQPIEIDATRGLLVQGLLEKAKSGVRDASSGR